MHGSLDTLRDKSFGYIYRTTNLITNKIYIGQSCWHKRVPPEKYLGSGKALKRALTKYGREAFTLEILFVAFTKDDLDYVEQRIIREHKELWGSKCYNISPGGRASLGFTGKRHTEEHKRRMSKILMGHPVTQKMRDNMSVVGRKQALILNTTKVECPHCGKIGSKPPMHVWHFEKCRFKDC